MKNPNTIMLVLSLYLYYYLALGVNKHMLDSARQNKQIKRSLWVEPWEVQVSDLGFDSKWSPAF